MTRRFAVVLLALVTIAPIALVIWRSVSTAAGLSLHHDEAAFTAPANIEALVNTVLISFATVVFATVLALPLALLVSRTDLPAARPFRLLLVVPYVVPPFLGAI